MSLKQYMGVSLPIMWSAALEWSTETFDVSLQAQSSEALWDQIQQMDIKKMFLFVRKVS